MFDLLIKGGTLPDGTTSDIGIKGDRISAVGRLDAAAVKVIDATGDLVSPPFVDPHFHMDAVLSYGLPRINASGTLLEGIGLWGELRETATVDEMVDRALRYCGAGRSQYFCGITGDITNQRINLGNRQIYRHRNSCLSKGKKDRLNNNS